MPLTPSDQIRKGAGSAAPGNLAQLSDSVRVEVEVISVVHDRKFITGIITNETCMVKQDDKLIHIRK